MFEKELSKIKEAVSAVAEAADDMQKVRAALEAIAETPAETVVNPATKPVVDENAPLMEYEPLSRAPSGFEYGEYSLKEAEDLRKVKGAMDKLDELSVKIKEADATFTGMRVELESKITDLKKETGYEGTKKEIGETQTKLAEEVQREFKGVSDSLGVSKKLLLRMKETLYTVYDKVTKKAVTDKDKLEALSNSMNKLLSKELIGAVWATADESIAQIAKADTEIQRRFVSFPATKDLHKKVKEELPKHAASITKEADIWQSIKSWFSGLVSAVKEFFTPVEESVTDLQSSLEQTEPILDEIDSLLAGSEATGSVQRKSDFSSEEDAYSYFVEKIKNVENTITSIVSDLDDIGTEFRGKIPKSVLEDVAGISLKIYSLISKTDPSIASIKYKIGIENPNIKPAF